MSEPVPAGREPSIHAVSGKVLHITEPRLLHGPAYDGVHIHRGGRLIAGGIISAYLRIEAGGTLIALGDVSAQPRLDDGALLDIRVPRLPRVITGTIPSSPSAHATTTTSSAPTAPSPRQPPATSAPRPIMHPATRSSKADASLPSLPQTRPSSS